MSGDDELDALQDEYRWQSEANGGYCHEFLTEGMCNVLVAGRDQTCPYKHSVPPGRSQAQKDQHAKMAKRAHQDMVEMNQSLMQEYFEENREEYEKSEAAMIEYEAARQAALDGDESDDGGDADEDDEEGHEGGEDGYDDDGDADDGHVDEEEGEEEGDTEGGEEGEGQLVGDEDGLSAPATPSPAPEGEAEAGSAKKRAREAEGEAAGSRHKK